MRYLHLKICVLCLALSPIFVVADTELETINVIAEDEPQTGDVQLEEHAGSHQRIKKIELQRQDVNLGDILANETGVQFRQVGGLGALSTVTMRGASSAQTGVFLDGIMLNSAGNSTIDLSMLELLNLTSVDIYRSSTPAQLSNANIGGAVNLNSLGPANGNPNTSAAITGGSFNTHRVQFSHRSSHNKWDVVAAASREASDNSFELLNNNATPLNPNDDTIEKRNNAQVTKLSALSRIGFQWSRDARSDFLLQLAGRDLGIPEWLNAEKNEASYDTDSAEFQFVNRFNGVGDWNTSLSFFQHYQNNHYLDALSQVGLAPQDTRSEVKTTGIKSYWERIGESGTFSFNASVRKETLDSEDALTLTQNYSVSRRSISASMQYALFAKDTRLLVTPSIRMYMVDDDFVGISRLTNNTHTDTKFSPQLGVRYTVNDKLTLRSSIGKFNREPAFAELFGSRGLIVGNSNLLPEAGVNADIGFTLTPNNRFQMDASLFGSWRDELIALLFDSQGVGRSANVGEAQVFGLEVGNNYLLSDQLSLRFNTTYQLSRNIADNPALDNRELPGEARLSAHTKLQYRKDNIRTWFESNYKSDFFYDQANLLPSESYWLHSAGIEYQWHDFQIGVTANNIGNDAIQDYNGFPRPGRSYFISLNYKL